MGADRLAQLGLTVQEGAGGPEVVLPAEAQPGGLHLLLGGWIDGDEP